MARFIAIMDRDGLVNSYQSCDDHECYMVVYGMVLKRKEPGQTLDISSFEPDTRSTCDNAGTWQQRALDNRVRRLHYLDSNIAALSGNELEY